MADSELTDDQLQVIRQSSLSILQRFTNQNKSETTQSRLPKPPPSDFSKLASGVLKESYARLQSSSSHPNLERRILLGDHIFKEDYEWLISKLRQPPTMRSRDDVDRILSMVVHNPFFADMPRALAAVLCKHLTFERFAQDDVVFEQGSPGHKFYLISQGSVAVIVKPPEGDSFVACTLHAGENFGERALLSDTDRRAATVKCTAPDNEFLVIHRSVYKLVKEYAEQEDNKRVDFLRQRVNLPVFRDVSQDLLLRICERMTPVIFKRGNLILSEGRNRPPALLYFVKSGQCTLLKALPPGKELPLPGGGSRPPRAAAAAAAATSQTLAAAGSTGGPSRPSRPRSREGAAVADVDALYPARKRHSVLPIQMGAPVAVDGTGQVAASLAAGRSGSIVSSLALPAHSAEGDATSGCQMIPIGSLSAGDFFGHLTVDCPRSRFSVVATTEVLLLQIPTAAFVEAVGEEIVRAMSTVLLCYDVEIEELRRQALRHRKWEKFKNEYMRRLLLEQHAPNAAPKDQIRIPSEFLREGFDEMLTRWAVSYGITPQRVLEGEDGFKLRDRPEDVIARARRKLALQQQLHQAGHADIDPFFSSTSSSSDMALQDGSGSPQHGGRRPPAVTSKYISEDAPPSERAGASSSGTVAHGVKQVDRLARCRSSLDWILRHGKLEDTSLLRGSVNEKPHQQRKRRPESLEKPLPLPSPSSVPQQLIRAASSPSLDTATGARTLSESASSASVGLGASLKSRTQSRLDLATKKNRMPIVRLGTLRAMASTVAKATGRDVPVDGLRLTHALAESDISSFSSSSSSSSQSASLTRSFSVPALSHSPSYPSLTVSVSAASLPDIPELDSSVKPKKRQADDRMATPAPAVESKRGRPHSSKKGLDARADDETSLIRSTVKSLRAAAASQAERTTSRQATAAMFSPMKSPSGLSFAEQVESGGVSSASDESRAKAYAAGLDMRTQTDAHSLLRASSSSIAAPL